MSRRLSNQRQTLNQTAKTPRSGQLQKKQKSRGNPTEENGNLLKGREIELADQSFLRFRRFRTKLFVSPVPG